MSAPLETPPVIGFAAWSGTGKTTLLAGLMPLLRAHGLRIGMIKHAHHGFDIDQPGKDSHILRKAGAEQVLIASRERWALMVETPAASDDPALAELLPRLDCSHLDLILVEGFRHERFPKIELHRAALGRPLLFPEDDSIIALASDTPIATALPHFTLGDAAGIAAFIMQYCGLTAYRT